MTIPNSKNLVTSSLVVLAVALFMVAGTPSKAHACSCAPQKVGTYIATADTVFLGRIGTARGPKHKRKRMFKVLHAIHGKVDAQVVLDEVVGGMCSPSWKAGEVALVFVKKGKTGLCAGNFSPATQLEHLMSEMLIHLGGKANSATLPIIKTALKSMTKGYLHRRPKVDLVFAPLAGRKFRLGKTRFTVVAKAGKGPTVKITSGVVWGRFAHVGLAMEDEGIVGNALLDGKGQAKRVIAKSVYEN